MPEEREGSIHQLDRSDGNLEEVPLAVEGDKGSRLFDALQNGEDGASMIASWEKGPSGPEGRQQSDGGRERAMNTPRLSEMEKEREMGADRSRVLGSFCDGEKMRAGG